jgi:hypothetical protein
MNLTSKMIAATLLLVGCGPHMTLMVHPKTGERVQCNAGMRDGVPIGQAQRENCVQQFTGLGFVPVDQLTPEQRETIIPKSRPAVVEHR